MLPSRRNRALREAPVFLSTSAIDDAARFLSKYKGIKGMDSIHLATAIVYGCDVFLTNDKQLKQVQEINVLLVDEL